MNTRLQHFVETHPALAWLASVLSWIGGAAAWLVDHADDVGKVFGLFATIFAMIAGYYVMRIQRRSWQRGATAAPFAESPRPWRRRPRD